MQQAGRKVESTVSSSAISDEDAYSPESDLLSSFEPCQSPAVDHLQSSKGVSPKLTIFGKIRNVFKTALYTVATAPKESWHSVKVTAGAAVALLSDPAARAVRENSIEDPEEEPEAGPSQYGTEGPVGRAKERWKEARNEMPEGAWGKIQWLWDQPPVKKLRITITAAQWSFRLPAILALLATQGSLLASQVSLPLLAPLLLGTGMMLRGIRSNASIIFPRICVLVVLLYVLWFFNSVVQNTVVYLRRQGAVDARVSGAIITASECLALLAAMIIVLSMIGVNVSGLLLPAGIALAYAAKDLSHNFLAGFFLFAVQPFKLGDRISVSYSSPAVASSSSRSAWFEGTCEKVDLRYTVVKNGSRRLFVPNQAFLTREFMVVDDSDSPTSSSKRDLFPPELAGHTEQDITRNQPYSSTVSQQSWEPAQPQYNWRPPAYEDEMMPSAVGPSHSQPPTYPGKPMRQWSGTGWQYQTRDSKTRENPGQPTPQPREVAGPGTSRPENGSSSIIRNRNRGQEREEFYHGNAGKALQQSPPRRLSDTHGS